MTSAQLDFSRIDLRGQAPTTAELRHRLPRGGTDVDSVIPTVAPIVDQVREGGARAALEIGQRFDGVTPDSVRVPAEVIDAAVGTLAADVIAALEEAIKRVRAFHSAIRPEDTQVEVSSRTSARVGQRCRRSRRLWRHYQRSHQRYRKNQKDSWPQQSQSWQPRSTARRSTWAGRGG